MRRKVTLNLDERFVEAMDQARGDVPRSRWIEYPWSPLTAHGLEGLSGTQAAVMAERLAGVPPPQRKQAASTERKAP